MSAQTALEGICNNEMAEFACKFDLLIRCLEHDDTLCAVAIIFKKEYVDIWDKLEALI